MARSRKTPVKVISACSGLGTECFALRKLGRPHKLLLACEAEEHLRRFLQLSHRPRTLLDDATSRSFVQSDSGHNADLFIAGFPCQPFSNQGRHGGTHDERGVIIWSLVEWMRHHTPRTFCLENVAGLQTTHKQTFAKIIKQLRDIKEGNKPCYSVVWRVLNSRKYGVPQDLVLVQSSLNNRENVERVK